MCVLAHFWSSLFVVIDVICSVFFLNSIILEGDKIMMFLHAKNIYIYITIAFRYNYVTATQRFVHIKKLLPKLNKNKNILKLYINI